MDVAIERVQAAAELARQRPLRAAEIAFAVWPQRKFLTGQRAAMAAGRIIGEMKRRGLSRFSVYSPRLGVLYWGWAIKGSERKG